MLSEPVPAKNAPAGGFSELARRACQGDQEAAALLFHSYRSVFLRVIRRGLRFPVRNLFDSEDILQEMAAAILRQRKLEAILASPQSFVAYLTEVAANKVVDLNRRYLLQPKRDLNQEIHLETLSNKLKARLISPATPPERVVAVEMDWQQFLDGLPPLQQQILGLVQQGYTHREMAELLHIEASKVKYQRRLVVEAIARWWKKWEEDIPI